MTSWWNKNVEARIHDFKSWVGDFNQPSKVYCRKYIADSQYKSMIDCGCGLATDYFGLKYDGYEIAYMGMDSCKYIVNSNIENGIPMIEAELESDFPIIDNAYDVVYCREVLEHLSYYEKTISEFIRVASKEVMVVFFIKPLNEYEWEDEIKDKIKRQQKEFRDEKMKLNISLGLDSSTPIEDISVIVTEQDKEINYWKSEDLYHNKYDKKKLEAFILNNPKVEKLFWTDICDPPYVVLPADVENISEADIEKPSGEKTILHIILKTNNEIF